MEKTKSKPSRFMVYVYMSVCMYVCVFGKRQMENQMEKCLSWALNSRTYIHTHTCKCKLQILLLPLGGHAHLAEPGCLCTKQAL